MIIRFLKQCWPGLLTHLGDIQLTRYNQTSISEGHDDVIKWKKSIFRVTGLCGGGGGGGGVCVCVCVGGGGGGGGGFPSGGFPSQRPVTRSFNDFLSAPE